MDYATLISQNDVLALAQVPVCDAQGLMLRTDAGISLACGRCIMVIAI